MRILIVMLIVLCVSVSAHHDAKILITPETYEIGDTMSISVFKCDSGSNVNVDLGDFEELIGKSDSKDTWNYEYKIPNNFPPGEHKVTGKCYDTKLSTTFKVLPPPDCTTKETVKEKIICRVENEQTTDMPDACSGLTVDLVCANKFTKFAECQDYDCISKVVDVDKENNYYLAALLERLRSFVEQDYQSGKITLDKMADLAQDIVNMQRYAVLDKPIVDKFNAYKQKRGLQ